MRDGNATGRRAAPGERESGGDAGLARFRGNVVRSADGIQTIF
jgi:hypothetical protein